MIFLITAREIIIDGKTYLMKVKSMGRSDANNYCLSKGMKLLENTNLKLHRAAREFGLGAYWNSKMNWKRSDACSVFGRQDIEEGTDNNLSTHWSYCKRKMDTICEQ